MACTDAFGKSLFLSPLTLSAGCSTGTTHSPKHMFPTPSTAKTAQYAGGDKPPVPNNGLRSSKTCNVFFSSDKSFAAALVCKAGWKCLGRLNASLFSHEQDKTSECGIKTSWRGGVSLITIACHTKGSVALSTHGG